MATIPTEINGKKVTKTETKFLESLDLGIDGRKEMVTNPFSGVSRELDNIQVAVYDFIKGAELIRDPKGMRLGLDMYRKYWVEEYFDLLD